MNKILSNIWPLGKLNYMVMHLSYNVYLNLIKGKLIFSELQGSISCNFLFI